MQHPEGCSEMGGKGEFEQMEEENIGWGRRYMLHPSSFWVKLLDPGLQPGEGPPLMGNLLRGVWEGDGERRDEAGKRRGESRGT